MGESGSGTVRILLIEDNRDDVRLVSRSLQSDPHLFSIQSVDRVSNSLSPLDARGVDLILLDTGLLDRRGPESFHRSRAHAADVPIIILTGDPVAGQEVPRMLVRGERRRGRDEGAFGIDWRCTVRSEVGADPRAADKLGGRGHVRGEAGRPPRGASEPRRAGRQQPERSRGLSNCGFS